MRSVSWKPAKGFKGLRENWKDDLSSGFLVALISLPLSIAIAYASNFPPVAGVITAIIGGIVATFFTNSELTIKGPAAGLVVVLADAVGNLGKGNISHGWHLALGAVVMAGVIQVLAGIFKLPRLVDLIPLPVIYGLFAGIGVSIMAKQIHLAVGIPLQNLTGKSPVDLIALLPGSLRHMEYHIAIIGLVSLMIMFGWRYLSFGVFKKIPKALVALTVSMILGHFFNLSDANFSELKPLLTQGDFDFGIQLTGIESGLLPLFFKYVSMIVLVAGLGSAMAVRMTDQLDPYKRTSSEDRDVIATGAATVASGLSGGLPVISEFTRSSANVFYGAKTRWANFFQGVMLLVVAGIAVPMIEYIPVASMAAVLIFVGFRLSSPATFYSVYDFGRPQLAIAMITLVVTVLTNVLIGVAVGILVRFAVQWIYGTKLADIVRSEISINYENGIFYVVANKAETFAKYLNLKFLLEKIPQNKTVQIQIADSPVLHQDVMDNLSRFTSEYEATGGKVSVQVKKKYQSQPDRRLRAERQHQRVTVMS